MKKLSITGRNQVLSLLKSNIKIIKVSLDSKDSNDVRIKEIIALCQQKNISLTFENRDFFKKYAESQGVYAEFEYIENIDLEKILQKDPLIVILKDILYKQNLAAIIRSCNIAGVDLLVLPKKLKDLHLDSEVLRISEGAALNTNIYYTNIFEFLDKLIDLDIKIFGVENFGQELYFNCNFKGAVGFLFGSEKDSLSEPLMKKCDKIVKIPQSKKSNLNSLNIASAVSIVIYEKIRQNSYE